MPDPCAQAECPRGQGPIPLINPPPLVKVKAEKSLGKLAEGKYLLPEFGPERLGPFLWIARNVDDFELSKSPKGLFGEFVNYVKYWFAITSGMSGHNEQDKEQHRNYCSIIERYFSYETESDVSANR
jgi:hypothetical protein